MTDTPSPAPLALVDDDTDPTRRLLRDLAESLRTAAEDLGALRRAVTDRAADLSRRAEEDAALARECLERGAYEAAARHCHRAHAASLAAVSLFPLESGR